jgi:anti-sigma B factor antagonist
MARPADSQPFSIDMPSPVRGVAIVAVAGEIDVASSPAFEEALAAAVRDRDQAGVCVDLTDVTFMDSSGLSALVRAVERHKRLGSSLAVATSDSRITTLFEVSRLDHVLRLYPTRDAAVLGLDRRSGERG